MSKLVKAISDGTFTFEESEDPNVFYFYRNDGGEVIGDADRIAMRFYQNWICTKMFNGEITETVVNASICVETSDDGKHIRLTVGKIEECKTKPEQPNLFKRLFSKFFK